MKKRNRTSRQGPAATPGESTATLISLHAQEVKEKAEKIKAALDHIELESANVRRYLGELV